MAVNGTELKPVLTKDADDWVPVQEFRLKAPGRYSALTSGRVHFSLAGLEHAAAVSAIQPVVVCVHGISAELTIWKHFVDFLVSKGRTVLSFDLFGRGFSDGSPRHNDLDLFLEQLTDLLNHPDVTSHVSTDIIDLVGSSLGGGISAAFTARNPERVRRAILLAPAGLGIIKFGASLQSLFHVPFIGRALISLANLRGLEKNMLQSFANPTDPQVVQFVKESSERAKALSENHPGYIPSLVSTIGYFPVSKMHDDFSSLQQRASTVLAIWGDGDNVVPYQRDSVTLHELAPGIEIFVIPGSGHIDHFVVDRYIAAFHEKAAAFLGL